MWLSMVLVVALLWALERWWLGEEKAGSFMLYFAIAMLIPTYNAAHGLSCCCCLGCRRAASWKARCCAKCLSAKGNGWCCCA